ncbi:MAG: hypothetical protein IKB08_07420 [Clostridia bacterium]|nr:hypothetical protein [Clostridia bacterium]
MRNTVALNDNWVFTPDKTDENSSPVSSKIKLPFFHDAKTMPKGTFSVSWTPTEKQDGKTVYIEFSQISGNCEVYSSDKNIGSHKASPFLFRVPLSLEVKAGEAYEIRVSVTPKARTDGLFAFAGVRLIITDSSHFNMTENGKGLSISSVLTEKTAVISVKADIIRPNNYDIVSFTVLNSKGDTVSVKTEKPTKAQTEIEFPMPELWDGQIGPYTYRLNAKLLRDSQCLDELELPFGFRKIDLKNDGFLYLNGFKLPLNGVKFTDCSAVKSDLNNLKTLDANILLSSSLPSKTNLLAETDRMGLLFWYEQPCSGDAEADSEQLKEFLLLYSHHPSLAAVVIDGADREYFSKLSSAVKENAPHISTVLKTGLEKANELIKDDISTVLVTIPCSTDPEAFINITGRFSQLIEDCPDKFFAVFPENPDKMNITPEELGEWHIRLWNSFCKQKGVIAYFGGLLSDGKALNSKRGLTGGDRTSFYDIFWYYKSQFSSKGFIKICELPQYNTLDKFTDIKCITNCSNIRILVNGKPKKYKAEKITDGMYIFRQLKLKKDMNLIEVSAGDECDSVEIMRI